MTRLALLALVLLAPAPGCAQQAAVQLAIRDVTVIPMTGAPPLEHATMLIRNDIAHLGTIESVLLRGRLLDGADLERTLADVLRAQDLRVSDWRR